MLKHKFFLGKYGKVPNWAIIIADYTYLNKPNAVKPCKGQDNPTDKYSLNV